MEQTKKPWIFTVRLQGCKPHLPVQARLMRCWRVKKRKREIKILIITGIIVAANAFETHTHIEGIPEPGIYLNQNEGNETKR